MGTPPTCEERAIAASPSSQEQSCFRALAPPAVPCVQDPSIAYLEWRRSCEGALGWGCQSPSPFIPQQSLLPCDETFVGPDGELYDVFYPPKTSRLRDCASESTGCDLYAEAAGAKAVQVTAPSNLRHKTSAEAGITELIAYMSEVALERYPGRVKLFQKVESSAMDALGQHFERLVLVGSIALGVDTPDSDLDAVAFTRSHGDGSGGQIAAPGKVEALRRIAENLVAQDATLQAQLVDGARVPVLTVVTADGKCALDLTVDEPLAERHVLWFQGHCAEPDQEPCTLRQVPVPPSDVWLQGLEAAAVRCVKWWLRRRGIPTAKEGGYPSIVWTLMGLHVLRCSVLVDSMSCGGDPVRTLLAAIAAFFDRFADGGLTGTLLFASGTGAMCRPQRVRTNGQSTRFPQQSPPEVLSVLDPTTTCEGCVASGIVPLELAPRISAGTQVLHAYEFRRAQRLSAGALMRSSSPHGVGAAPGCGGGAALSGLFAEVSPVAANVLPAALPSEATGAIVFACGKLLLGVIQQVQPRSGWRAEFLHRQHTYKGIALHLCNVDTDNRVARARSDEHAVRWFRPCDFVCTVPLPRSDGAAAATNLSKRLFVLEADSCEKWRDMQGLINGDPQHSPGHGRAAQGTGGRGGQASRRRIPCRPHARPVAGPAHFPAMATPDTVQPHARPCAR